MTINRGPSNWNLLLYHKNKATTTPSTQKKEHSYPYFFHTKIDITMSDSTGAPKDDNSRRSAKLDSGTGEPHELKKDKSQALVKPPLDSTKNAPFIVERIPEFRYVKPSLWTRTCRWPFSLYL